jgi:hypothetical protein
LISKDYFNQKETAAAADEGEVAIDNNDDILE